jgi:hypothetical protein
MIEEVRQLGFLRSLRLRAFDRKVRQGTAKGKENYRFARRSHLI